MAMFEKHFSVDEANDLLPYVASIFEKIHSIREELGTRKEELEKLHKSAPGNGGGTKSVDFVVQSEAVGRFLADLEEKGILVKDIDIGLIDFPHVREDREVLLCWKLGEKSIGFWHEINTGFQGRQSL